MRTNLIVIVFLNWWVFCCWFVTGHNILCLLSDPEPCVCFWIVVFCEKQRWKCLFVMPRDIADEELREENPDEDHIILGHLQNTFKCYENKSYCYCIFELMGLLLRVPTWQIVAPDCAPLHVLNMFCEKQRWRQKPLLYHDPRELLLSMWMRNNKL